MTRNKAPLPAKANGEPALGQRKQQVLEMLEEASGTSGVASGWASGELISERLGISRAAVSKHVSALRRDGHIIDSAPRRGFYLRVRDSVPARAEVCRGLNAKIAGKGEWRSLEETTSTSSEAVAWASEGAREGCMVLAEKQTRGRGRNGHDWFSAPRGLQLSLILRPRGASFLSLPVEQAQTLLTRVAALSVTEAVRAVTGLTPTLKEPNDVLLGKCKFCGVLVEAGFQAGSLDWVVIGIGCNVNALPEDFPPALRAKTCSLLSAGGRSVSRPDLLRALLERLDYWYDGFNSTSPERFAECLGKLDAAWQNGA
ncbi:biotin--[acetyl-CoA-carboxylase] ligase [Desulfovibrio sp. OttesenSCG-928-C06]|nr:biotin--[acetyl-CoA-carboxylase] ligase [Desulfovibrio sp. OttesenSCG-928-C06]